MFICLPIQKMGDIVAGGGESLSVSTVEKIRMLWSKDVHVTFKVVLLTYKWNYCFLYFFFYVLNS